MSVTQLPLTVVLYDGPIGRAYLARLKQFGFRPEAILLLVLDQHPATKKAYPTWLPFRRWYAEKMQSLTVNHWPRMLLAKYPTIVASIHDTLEAVYPQAKAMLATIIKPMVWHDYADQVEQVMISNLKDPRLTACLQTLAQKTLLYTGGGIIPKHLFDIAGLRWLHVHPGHLPFVRGADGVLWGLTTRGCPGAGLFYMEAGLDTGPVIRTSDLPTVAFAVDDHERPDDQMLYRMLYSYYDPLLRADFLVQTLQQLPHLRMNDLPAIPQDHAQSVTYRFMDEAQRTVALKLLFPTQLP